MRIRLHDIMLEFKDYYEVDENGSIYSDNCGLMKTRNKHGAEYQIINFQTINGKKTFRVHRLILMCFEPIDNPEAMEVNHIDGNKSNNRIDNLEWCSRAENQKHAYNTGLAVGRKGEKSNFSKLSEENIKEIFRLREKGLLQREIADILGCTRSNISYILNKKTWQI